MTLSDLECLKQTSSASRAISAVAELPLQRASQIVFESFDVWQTLFLSQRTYSLVSKNRFLPRELMRARS